MKFHDTTHTGELTSRMGSDIQELGLLLGNYFGTGIINLVQTLGSLGVSLLLPYNIVNGVYLTHSDGVYSSSSLPYHHHHILQRQAREEAQSRHQRQSRRYECVY